MYYHLIVQSKCITKSIRCKLESFLLLTFSGTGFQPKQAILKFAWSGRFHQIFRQLIDNTFCQTSCPGFQPNRPSMLGRVESPFGHGTEEFVETHGGGGEQE